MSCNTAYFPVIKHKDGTFEYLTHKYGDPKPLQRLRCMVAFDGHDCATEDVARMRARDYIEIANSVYNRGLDAVPLAGDFKKPLALLDSPEAWEEAEKREARIKKETEQV